MEVVRLGSMLAAVALAFSVAAGVSAARPDGSAAIASKWRLAYATEVEGRRGLDVYVVDVPGGSPRRLVGEAGRDDFTPAWSPDGRSIAFRRNPARGDVGDIFVVAATGGRARA